jgi:pimeloyl-ACP methyl ester carboxylesterase
MNLSPADLADQPLLMVSGALDRRCPRPLQQRMAPMQPNAQWVDLPLCGYLVPLEKPVALTRILSRCLSRTQNTPPARSFA